MRLRLMAMRARKVAFAFVEGQIAGTESVPFVLTGDHDSPFEGQIATTLPVDALSRALSRIL